MLIDGCLLPPLLGKTFSINVSELVHELIPESPGECSFLFVSSLMSQILSPKSFCTWFYLCLLVKLFCYFDPTKAQSLNEHWRHFERFSLVCRISTDTNSILQINQIKSLMLCRKSRLKMYVDCMIYL